MCKKKWFGNKIEVRQGKLWDKTTQLWKNFGKRDQKEASASWKNIQIVQQ
jgi:hypothetical protein